MRGELRVQEVAGDDREQRLNPQRYDVTRSERGEEIKGTGCFFFHLKDQMEEPGVWSVRSCIDTFRSFSRS